MRAKTLWTFYLRHGVTFHDGTPFNAAAVKFSMERMEGVNQSPSYVFGQFVGPKDIEIVDNYTVRLHLHAPAPRLLYAFASQYGSLHGQPDRDPTTRLKKRSVGSKSGLQGMMQGRDHTRSRNTRPTKRRFSPNFQVIGRAGRATMSDASSSISWRKMPPGAN